MQLQRGLVCLQAHSGMEHKGDTGRVETELDRTVEGHMRVTCAYPKPNPNLADITYSY